GLVFQNRFLVTQDLPLVGDHFVGHRFVLLEQEWKRPQSRFAVGNHPSDRASSVNSVRLPVNGSFPVYAQRRRPSRSITNVACSKSSRVAPDAGRYTPYFCATALPGSARTGNANSPY